jgi:hypothetical protein
MNTHKTSFFRVTQKNYNAPGFNRSVVQFG